MRRFQGIAAGLLLGAIGQSDAIGQDGPPLLPPQGSATPQPAPAPSEGLGPPLMGPSGMPTSAPRPSTSRPIPLESLPPSEIETPRAIGEPKPSPEKPDQPEKPPKGPVRRGRLLDRLLPVPPARGRIPGRTSDAIAIEPRSDPAADAALKKRIEVQAAEAVGDRASKIEVRVVDRSVTIRAHVDRFWNRRAVKRSLEALPGLRGSKAKVDVDG